MYYVLIYFEYSPGNVKVKEQRFYKRSTNVPTSNRNETKKSEFVPKCAPSKEHMSFWSRRADSGPNRNNLFSRRQIRGRSQNILVLFPKRYRNVCPFVFYIWRFPPPTAFFSEIHQVLYSFLTLPVNRRIEPFLAATPKFLYTLYYSINQFQLFMTRK